MNKLKEITGQVFLSGSFLVRQFEKKTLFAGISKTLPFEHSTEYPEDEIWVAQLIIPEPQRYSLKGTKYASWSLEDIIKSEIKLSELKKL